MFIKLISVAFFIFLFAIQASAQSPQIPPEQDADSAAKSEEPAKQDKEDGDKPSVGPKPPGPSEKSDSQKVSKNPTEKMTTVVVPAKDNRLTLADYLQILFTLAVAVFTFFLVVFTKKLSDSTEKLWKTSNVQSDALKNSVIEANRSALAMEGVAKNIEDGTKLSQDTFKKQMRGYVCATVFDTAFQVDNPKSRFGASVNIVNTGFTPAYIKSFRIKAAILDGDIPRENALKEAPETSVEAVLGHQQNLTMAAFVDDSVQPEEIPIIKFGQEKALFVWGSVYYEDIYTEKDRGEHDRFIDFCFKIFWLPGDKPWITHYGKYNKGN